MTQMDGNREKNIAFVSKRFSGAAARWSTIDQESYTIFFALKSWKPFLEGHKFVVETGHKNIVHIMSSRKFSSLAITHARIRFLGATDSEKGYCDC
jgi:hypothetical protein